MKKLLLFILVLVMCLFVCACGEKGSSAKNDATKAESNIDSSSASESESETETEEQSEPEVVIYQFGDSITSPSGMFVFTPSADGFTNALGNTMNETYLLPVDEAESNNPYAADEGKTMLYFSAVVDYVGDSKQNETFDFSFKVDFDNGYVFEGSSGKGFSFDKEDWTSNAVKFEPLGSDKICYVRFCIEVPETLKIDVDKDLVAIFTIEEEEFSFSIDAKALADAEAKLLAEKEAERADKMTKVDDALANEIKSKMQGTFSWDIYGYAASRLYTTTHELTFNGDTVYIKTTNSLMNSVLNNQGTYYIAKAYIVMDFADGSHACMPYTYENGELSISSEFEGAFYTA